MLRHIRLTTDFGVLLLVAALAGCGIDEHVDPLDTADAAGRSQVPVSVEVRDGKLAAEEGARRIAALGLAVASGVRSMTERLLHEDEGECDVPGGSIPPDADTPDPAKDARCE